MGASGLRATRWARAAAVAVLAGGWLWAAAAPVAAHAVLQETAPVPDAVVADAPEAVQLRFTEGVDPGLGGVRVVGPDGARVDRGRVERSDGDRVLRVPLDGGGQGTYTVAWSVVSEDGHAISGSFVYSVGRVTGTGEVADRIGTPLRATAAGGRWAAFAGTLALFGGLAFSRLVLPAAGADAGAVDDRRLRRLLLVGAALAVVGAAVALLAQVAIAAGRSLPGSVGLVGDAVTTTRFGALGAVRLGAAALALALLASWRLAASRVGAIGLAAASIGLVVVPGLAGHAWTATPRWAAVTLDAVHLVAASVWIGGLAALVVVAPGSAAARALAERFSAVAFGAVGVVVVTGTASSYLQVRAVDGLTDTGYGQLLVAKVAVVAALVALGWVNRRRLVARLPERATVFAVARAELALAVAVVAVTAVLVNRPPARGELARPFSATLALQGDPEGGLVDVQVSPARSGRNDVHLYFLSRQGLPRPVDAVELSVSRSGVPPRTVAVTPITPDHASAYGVVLPSPGVWTLTVVGVRTGTAGTAVAQVQVR